VSRIGAVPKVIVGAVIPVDGGRSRSFREPPIGANEVADDSMMIYYSRSKNSITNKRNKRTNSVGEAIDFEGKVD
jgi:hypothetical protein